MTAYPAADSRPAGPAPNEWQLDKTGPTFLLPLPDPLSLQEGELLREALPLPEALPIEAPPFPRDYFLKHYCYLFEGHVGDATRIGSWINESVFLPQSPNYFWPADHAWCVTIATDSDSTTIGGSRQLVDELCASASV
jgi:hypothetical protein